MPLEPPAPALHPLRLCQSNRSSSFRRFRPPSAGNNSALFLACYQSVFLIDRRLACESSTGASSLCRDGRSPCESSMNLGHPCGSSAARRPLLRASTDPHRLVRKTASFGIAVAKAFHHRNQVYNSRSMRVLIAFSLKRNLAYRHTTFTKTLAVDCQSSRVQRS